MRTHEGRNAAIGLNAPASRFAPAERASDAAILRQSRLLVDEPLLQQLYDAISECVLVLNQQRQIVFGNHSFARLLALNDRREVYGLRPGEALGCVHACEAPGGCGTTEFCAVCGAVQAVLASQQGNEDTRECRIRRREPGEDLDLLVRATPLELGGESLTVCAITDISNRKRRRTLERAFFHDLMNAAVGLRLLCRSIANAVEGDPGERIGRLAVEMDRFVEEIAAHRDLAAAEGAGLAVRPTSVESLDVLKDAVDLYERLASAERCELRIDPGAERVRFRTDRAILGRVLGNMVKNAIEASGEGQIVTVGCETGGGGVAFWVHNETPMPNEVQLQLFQRSFSTKGEGRGIGTYSMKLLSEKYLGGRVSFTTSEETGTIFSAWHPMDLTSD